VVEIYSCNTSTKRSLDIAPFDRITKSGDGGDIVDFYTSVISRHLDLQKYISQVFLQFKIGS
jgi:hypothetical protein